MEVKGPEWPRQTGGVPQRTPPAAASWLVLNGAVSIPVQCEEGNCLLESLTRGGRINLTIRRIGVAVMRTKRACVIGARRGLFK